MRGYSFVFLFLFSISIYAQKQSIKFLHILPENGLSHSFVSCVIQDRHGFMWFGTKDGLNKFDGYTFTIYKNEPGNIHSLSNNFVQDLLIDKQGNLWIASWGGLSKFDTRSETFTQYMTDKNDPRSIPNDLISNITEDEHGNLWMGTEGGLVNFDLKNNKFITYRHDKNDPESLSNDYVRDMYIDEDKRMWVGTYSGGLNLFDFNTKKFKRYLHNPSIATTIGDNSAYTIFQDSKKRMWIGHKNGFDFFDRKSGSFTRYVNEPGNPNSLIHNVVTCFEEDDQGYIWIGTENGGMSIFDPETKKFYNYKHDDIDNNSLGSNSLYAIYKDADSNMWLATFSDGINFYSHEGNKFTHFKHSSSTKSLSNNNVLCFFEDSNDNLWIGTDGGGANIYNRKTKEFTSFRNDSKNDNSLAGDYVLSISEDSNHHIWFGTWGAGVSVYDPFKKKFRHFKNKPVDSTSLSSNNAWRVYCSIDKNMWVGTYRGSGLELYIPETNTFRSYSNNPLDSESISNNYINSIIEDSKGNFWIGTGGGGLNLFDRKNNKFISYIRDNKPNSLSSNNVDCVFEDSKGNLWLGTDLGLNLMDSITKRFTTFTIKDGLPVDNIFGISEDNAGYLWISSTNGLSKFDPVQKIFTNYTVADGLQSQEFKPHAFLKSKTGAMYFGGINGFNEFFPGQLFESKTDPPLYLTNFKLFHKSVSVGVEYDGKVILKESLSSVKEIVLSHVLSFFSFEFAMLNYTVPEKNHYAYKLEGFDDEWNYIGSSRVATYTDIPPGTYTFKVKGSQNGKTWNENGIAIAITITPPFWKTWWFTTMSAITVGGAIWGFYAVRMRQIRAQKEVLEKQVQERTIDLQEAAKEIQSQRDSLKSSNEYVMSSINYANSIQKAILSTREKIQATVSDYFIIYKPKDVVSGDFYWFSYLPLNDLNLLSQWENKVDFDQKFIAAVDCTGHGVSGAFMSIIGNTLFNEIVNQKHVFDPALILEMLDEGLKKVITPENGVNIAGMDVCLCRLEEVDKENVKVSFSGARRPLYYVKKGSKVLEKINGDIVSIGSDFKEGNAYHTHQVILEKGSLLYLTTDGYADQNNVNKEKISTAGLKRIIEENCHLPLEEQKIVFESILADHQKDVPQRDDITVIGVRI